MLNSNTAILLWMLFILYVYWCFTHPLVESGASSPGSLLQLVAKGPQDYYLTGLPRYYLTGIPRNNYYAYYPYHYHHPYYHHRPYRYPHRYYPKANYGQLFL